MPQLPLPPLLITESGRNGEELWPGYRGTWF